MDYDNNNANFTYGHNPLGFSCDYCCFYGNDGFPTISSLGPNYQTGSPMFQDYDYNIGATSSCRDNGYDVFGLPTDVDGDDRDSDYDIGAQEYQ